MMTLQSNPKIKRATCMKDLDLKAAAQLDYERNFGIAEDIEVTIAHLGSEQVVLVETLARRVYYSMDLQILKVTNQIGES